MAKIAHELLADLDKETVDFGPNYDGSEHEPLVFPARFPNLLVNGSSGIAVGMATNIPPHNMTEVVDACLALLKSPDMDIEQLIELVPAPDFPTAGFIYGLAGVKEGYRTGRGRVIMRARTHFEDIGKGDRQAIIIDELPYQVNKATLLMKIGEMVREKRIEGISEIRDESDKSGMRAVIELKRGENADVMLNQLYKDTQMQDSFGINMVAIIDGQPKLLNLKQVIEAFLRHRREVVTRRTIFELRKARERGHILEGLAVALSNVDEIIALIKAAPTPPDAKRSLMGRSWRSSLVEDLLSRVSDASRPEGLAPEFGLVGKDNERGYFMSDAQAQAILELRLQRLTGLEQDKIVGEYREVMDKITDLLDILAKPARVTQIIGDELVTIRSQFGDKRRSEIITHTQDMSMEDLIAPEDVVVTMSHGGYMKAQKLDEYRAQKRGGRGKQATATKEDDFVDNLFIANTHDYILCFSNRGRVYWLKVYDVPQGTRISRGKPIVNLLPLEADEKINAILPVKQFTEDQFIFFATTDGTVKKTPLSDFANPRKAGIIAINLDEGDFLIGVAITDGKHDVMLFSNEGKAVRFDENDVRSMGRVTRGVRGMNLSKGGKVIALLVAGDETQTVLTATENGFGKRTPISEYTRHGRGTQGMIAIQTSERNGKVVAATLVSTEDEIMLIGTSGVLIRTRVKEIREMSRATQGVTLMNMGEGEKLAGLSRIAEPEEESEEQ
jgi:DNA gyrase subunit A